MTEAILMEATLATLGDLKRDHHVHGVRRFGAATLDLAWSARSTRGVFRV